jgi:hypothetical protein
MLRTSVSREPMFREPLRRVDIDLAHAIETQLRNQCAHHGLVPEVACRATIVRRRPVGVGEGDRVALL